MDSRVRRRLQLDATGGWQGHRLHRADIAGGAQRTHFAALVRGCAPGAAVVDDRTGRRGHARLHDPAIGSQWLQERVGVGAIRGLVEAAGIAVLQVVACGLRCIPRACATRDDHALETRVVTLALVEVDGAAVVGAIVGDGAVAHREGAASLVERTGDGPCVVAQRARVQLERAFVVDGASGRRTLWSNVTRRSWTSPLLKRPPPRCPRCSP